VPESTLAADGGGDGSPNNHSPRGVTHWKMSLTISSLTDDAALAFDPLLLPKLGRAMDERRRIAVDEDDERRREKGFCWERPALDIYYSLFRIL
jgi:hypothetical protein